MSSSEYSGSRCSSCRASHDSAAESLSAHCAKLGSKWFAYVEAITFSGTLMDGPRLSRCMQVKLSAQAFSTRSSEMPSLGQRTSTSNARGRRARSESEQV
jgi:hypothetical protein